VGPGSSILIVEDDEEWRDIYKLAVEDHDPNLTVRTADSRVAAERLIDAAKFAVAFVDISLDASDGNNKDGLKVMEKIRKAGDETTIIVVSGRGGQDALSIASAANRQYGAHDTVAKLTADPDHLVKLLAEGLEKYRKVAVTSRTAVRDALRGAIVGVNWDDQVTRAIGFRGNVQRFYGFLNELMGGQLPIVPRGDGQPVTIDPDLSLVHGDYWSRGTAAAAVVCFGAPAQFDKAIEAASTDGMLLGRYQIGGQVATLDRDGIKGAVIPLSAARREDFAGQRVGS
jgi:CheY-like chemotaxis protein